MFQRAPMANHSVLYTNGTETSSIAMGASHFSQDGIIGGEEGRFERTTFRVNSEQQAGDRFKVGQNVTFTNIKRNALAENNEFATPVLRALNIDPVTPVTVPTAPTRTQITSTATSSTPSTKSNRPTTTGRPTVSWAMCLR